MSLGRKCRKSENVSRLDLSQLWTKVLVPDMYQGRTCLKVQDRRCPGLEVSRGQKFRAQSFLRSQLFCGQKAGHVQPCLIASRLDLSRAGNVSWLELIFPMCCLLQKILPQPHVKNYPLSTFARVKKIGSDEFSFILEGAKIHQKIDQAHFKMATDS